MKTRNRRVVRMGICAATLLLSVSVVPTIAMAQEASPQVTGPGVEVQAAPTVPAPPTVASGQAARPVVLPRTGGEPGADSTALLAGVAILAAGLTLRHRARRTAAEVA